MRAGLRVCPTRGQAAMPVLESVGRIGNPSHAGTRINRLVGQTLSENTQPSQWMLVGRRASTFQPQAGGLGQPVEERGLRYVVDDLGDFVVGIVLAQALNVGVGDERWIDGD